MPDVMTYAQFQMFANSGGPGYPQGSGFQNGSIVCSVQETGAYSRRDPDFNKAVPSGTIISRLDTRFDSHYGGPPSGVNGL